MAEGKVAPYDIDSEQAVLGCIISDKDVASEAISKLSENSFYRLDNQYIFTAMKNLYSKAQTIDILTVKNELSSMGVLDKIGGIEYLATLQDKVPTTANFNKYINIISEKATKRELIKAGNEIISAGYDETIDLNDSLDKSEKLIYEISRGRQHSGSSSIKDILVESFTTLEELYNNKKEVTGVPSGFYDLDKKTAGFHESELILIGARPGMGKTALALNIATHAALKAKCPVLIFSLEMDKKQIINRIWSSVSQVESNKLRTGKVEDKDWVKLTESSGILTEQNNIYVDDTAFNINEIRAKARKLKNEFDIGMVVVDYLQLVQGSNHKTINSREQEISEISRSLKLLAKELHIPIIALSQINRSADSRPDHRPQLSDLRESGAIEQDADVVMFIFREDYYDEQTERKNIAEVTIAKNRSGSLGKTELYWMPSYTKFANYKKY